MPSPRRVRLALIVLPVLSASGGCYAYLPAADPGALEGKRISLTLTDSGSVVMASRVGPAVAAIEGTYVADSAGSYLVSVLTTRQRSGQEVDWRGEHVAVARPLVATVEERTFSRPRSLLAGGLAAVGLAAITAALRGKGENTGSANGGGPPVVQ